MAQKKDNSSLSPYLRNLLGNPDHFQIEIEGLLEKYKVQPIGSGYIDLLLERENSVRLIDELSELPIVLEMLTWWCLTTLETKSKFGCPHGYGGPANKFGEGWFSECRQYPAFVASKLPSLQTEITLSLQIFVKESNRLVADYIKNILPTEKFFSPCLFIGLWLSVPKNWKRKYYLANAPLKTKH